MRQKISIVLIFLQSIFRMFIFIILLNDSIRRNVLLKRRHEQVRLHNLELLVAEAGSAVALARRASTSESYLSQIRRQLPTAKGTPRSVGDSLAEKLERAMGKPHGWMDEPHNDASPEKQRYLRNAEPGPGIRSLHPLISWAEAAKWTVNGEDVVLQGQTKDLLPCPVSCSEETFVLRVKGESMEPKFHDGDLIFVDPKVTPESGRYVVVTLEDSAEATFKQLIVEGGHQYLKALNPDWPDRIIRLNENATICGVVVFKGEAV